jgi:hypothetical protein
MEMNANSLFLLTASILITFNLSQVHVFTPSKQKYKPPYKSHPFYQGVLFGNKRALKLNIKRKFKRLGVLHLLTPSGIHLSSLLILPKIFFPKLLTPILVLLSLALTLFDHSYYSLLRVTNFLLIRRMTKLSFQKCFALTFLFDLVLGHYHQSPLSFTYSFAFWGVFIFAQNKYFILRNYVVIILIISVVNAEAFYPFAVVTNFILTPLFSLLYPLFITIHWSEVGTLIADMFLNIINTADTLLLYTPSLLNITYYLPLFILRNKFFVLYLLLLSLPLENQSIRYSPGKYYIKAPQAESPRIRNSNKLKYLRGINCKSKIMFRYRIEKCREY